MPGILGKGFVHRTFKQGEANVTPQKNHHLFVTLLSDIFFRFHIAIPSYANKHSACCRPCNFACSAVIGESTSVICPE
jgi:hypothetical protein